MSYIYAIYEVSGTELVIRYVGQTTLSPIARYNMHVQWGLYAQIPVSKLLNDYIARNKELNVLVLEEVESKTRFARERFWIESLCVEHPLVNIQHNFNQLAGRLAID